ncbi:Triosephosphate isomerase [Planctomycetes bacterium Pan216]|uniref:Triosephosphate isomerase n=1 Tax=Kolteria novifilia TaxID=2527975 RepID=A0A518B100_9BACT|nr:Triosephosphate isomerase [Planctomycetes bacterium Pan216]
MSDRRPFIAGNWKMNLVREEGERLVRDLIHSVGEVKETDIAVCPPFPYLSDLHDVLVGSNVALGAQNMSFEAKGAFTGEVSSSMLLDVGCKYVILGHSERRELYGEDDEAVNRKVKAAVDAGLKPIVCVGERLEQHEAGQSRDVCSTQLRGAFVGIPPEQFRQVTIAYEPVWAIGTGRVATPEHAEEIHGHIRERLTDAFGADLALQTRILYGGSVKPSNAEGLLSQPNVDGALVGGASLKADDFAGIIHAAEKVAMS